MEMEYKKTISSMQMKMEEYSANNYKSQYDREVEAHDKTKW